MSINLQRRTASRYILKSSPVTADTTHRPTQQPRPNHVQQITPFLGSNCPLISELRHCPNQLQPVQSRLQTFTSTASITSPRVSPMRFISILCLLVVATAFPTTSEFCRHRVDPKDNKCYEGCATETFKSPGLIQLGECWHAYSVVDSESTIEQCNDGKTNVKYCSGGNLHAVSLHFQPAVSRSLTALSR